MKHHLHLCARIHSVFAFVEQYNPAAPAAGPAAIARVRSTAKRATARSNKRTARVAAGRAKTRRANGYRRRRDRTGPGTPKSYTTEGRAKWHPRYMIVDQGYTLQPPVDPGTVDRKVLNMLLLQVLFVSTTIAWVPGGGEGVKEGVCARGEGGGEGGGGKRGDGGGEGEGSGNLR